MNILKLALTLLFISIVYSQVLGIDLGTEYWKASLISPGKNLIVVENSRSGRKSHNGIAFVDGIRHFEYDAFTKRQKKPKSTYFYLKTLMQSLDNQKPLQGYRFENGTYYFQQGQDTISLEQMVGMILKNIKKFSSQQANTQIKDVVFTVPAHWGFSSRISLVNAASIADLNTLGLINQNTAAAIHFGITRNDTDPVNIGFFNYGSANLQISIAQFFGTHDTVKQKNIQSMRILSHVSIPQIGGLQIDEQIAQYIAKQFQNKHKVNIKDNQKSWTKLLHKCADVKQTLSANKQVNVYIEALINGIDLNTVIKRQILQKSNVFVKIQEALQLSLKNAGIKKQDLHSVELIGGASRIPLVGKILKQFYDPIEVGAHINGDESMAFGSALRAANLSITFRVKQLFLYDGHSQNIRAVVTNVGDGVVDSFDLYNKDSEHGLRKQISLDAGQEDIKVDIFYGEQIIHTYSVSNLSSWNQKYNKSQLNFTENPKLVLTFVANSISLASLKEAYINITLNTSTTRQIYQVVMQNVTIQQKKQNKTPQNSTQQGGNQAKNQTQQQLKIPKFRQRSKTVKKVVDDFKIQNKKIHLKYKHEYAKYQKLTKQQVAQLQEVIMKYEKKQNYLKQKAKVRNDLQSTLYRIKEDIQNNPAMKTFASQSQIDKLKLTVDQQLSWLDQNAWTAQKDDFNKHFQTLLVDYDPIVNRSSQWANRQKTYNKSIQILSLVYSKTLQLNNTQPWVSEKAIAHLVKINQTVVWMRSKIQKQLQKKPNENIIFYNHQMIQKAEDLRQEYYLIKMIPRPKIIKKPEPKQTEQKNQNKKQTDEQIDLDIQIKSEQKKNQEAKVEQQTKQQNENDENKQEDPQVESNLQQSEERVDKQDL